ncbi:MAG: DNA polymerase III subunit alpha [Bacillota bacterium]
MQDFVHLHNHSEFSLLDGAIRLDELIELTQKHGQKACALTDHGNLHGMVKFYQKAKRAGIKPIIGCEVYITPGSRREKRDREIYHLILLAENILGYKNLIKIVSKAHLEGFYYKPRVDKDLLTQYSQGLIATSACLQGEIPQKILAGNPGKAEKLINDYKQLFGQDNFFLEIQDHGLAEEKQVNPVLLELAGKTGTHLIAANDAHYSEQEDAKFHDLLLALQTGKNLDDEDRMTFPNDKFYFKSTEEMAEKFAGVPEALDNTAWIAERCNVDLDFSQFYLPAFPAPEEQAHLSSEELLKKYCYESLKDKYPNSQEAKERLREELNIICEMGYAPYFLIVHDFIQEAMRKNIQVGPGRGSAAGSLVSYLLDITRVDPLKYGLIFERFLNPERVNLPDIDIDFDDRRDEVIEYVRDKYGRDKVAQIGTFGTMAARGAVRDVGRALNLSYDKVDRVAKKISSRPGITLAEAIQNSSQLQQMARRDEEIERLLELAQAVEGLPRHISTHAAGVIIGADPLIEQVPLQLQDDVIITQLAMEEVEELGLLKMDFLGLRNLSVIRDSLDLIHKNYGKEIDIENIPLDDMEVYELLGKGKTAGVFQMESYLFQNLNKKLKPDRFEDIIALLALGRPGPLGSNLVDDYILCRHGKKEPEYLHPDLEPILADTYGLILYQEQVMEIASEIGNFSMGQADILRRGMGKKKEELVASERKRFIAGAQENDISPDTADQIFDQMEYFSGYGFNKSHSAAYALVAYQTAYLKVKYPAEFMAALLSSVMTNLSKIGDYISAAQEIDLQVLPPDLNESFHDFVSIPPDKIRFGLKAVKNLGSKAIEEIIKERKKGQYKSIVDFFKRVNLSVVNQTALESLVYAGAFESFPENRAELISALDHLCDKYKQKESRTAAGQRSFFDMVNKEEEFYQDDFNFRNLAEYDQKTILKQEKEALGVYLSGHPLDPYNDIFIKLGLENLMIPETKQEVIVGGFVTGVKEHITKNQKRMAFLTLESWSDIIEVIIFPEAYQKYGHILEEDNILLISGKSDEGKVIANNIILLEEKPLLVELEDETDLEFADIKEKMLQQKSKRPVILVENSNANKGIIMLTEEYWVDNDFDQI